MPTKNNYVADLNNFTIGTRPNETINEEIPGPGTYENTKTRTVKPAGRATNFSSSKKTRSFNQTSTMVGPGYY